MKSNSKLALAVTCLVLFSTPAFADDSGKWHGKLYSGYSALGSQSIGQTGVASLAATGEISNDGGWTAGGAVGYNYTNNLSVELAWDYITNDSTNSFSDGTSFDDGDFSSSIFYLQGVYKFNPVMNTKIRPYLGAGLGYVEEIDMDLISGDIEASYSSDGEFAYRLMAGVSYLITDKIDFNADIHYVQVASFDLTNESDEGTLLEVGYDPVIFTLGASYKF